MNKLLFLILLSINSYADCFNDEFDYQLIIKGEVTSEDKQNIKDYCESIQEIDENDCEIECDT